MNRATQLGLVLLAASGTAALSAVALATGGQRSEAIGIGWAAWWTTLVGLVVAVVGILTGGLFGLLREKA